MAWRRCDDVDGSVDDVQPVQIGYGNQLYVLHLGPDNRLLLDEALAPFLTDQEARRALPELMDIDPETRDERTARPTRADRPRSSRPQSANGGYPSGRPKRTQTENDAIRVWANENGHPLSNRGRIPGSVLDAYDEANPRT